MLLVELLWRDDDHRTDVFPIEQRFDGLARYGTEVVGDALSGHTVCVGHSRETRITYRAGEVLRVTPTHEADADHTDAHRIPRALQRRPSTPSISCIRT
jgi:hypothetical protein